MNRGCYKQSIQFVLIFLLICCKSLTGLNCDSIRCGAICCGGSVCGSLYDGSEYNGWICKLVSILKWFPE